MKFFDTGLRPWYLLLASVLAYATPVGVRAQEISISYNSDWPPYSHGLRGEVAGILPRLLDELIGMRLGYAVRHNGAPWKRAQRLVEQGKLDAFVTVPTTARLKYAKRSASIVYSMEMLASVKRFGEAHKKLGAKPTIDTVRTMRVCDLLGNGWAEQFYAKHKVEYFKASNAADCLRLISRGRADVIIQPAAVAVAEIMAAGLKDKIATLPTAYGALKFALLVSAKYEGADELLARFDELVERMRSDGSYGRLIANLRGL